MIDKRAVDHIGSGSQIGFDNLKFNSDDFLSNGYGIEKLFRYAAVLESTGFGHFHL